ncbi:calcium channel protein [Tulasnella sp. 427]|nr:calcium channel protein [Tulasnella sp. 427]
MQRPSHPSSSLSTDSSSSTAIAAQYGSYSPPDANAGAKRRNSWNKSRESISEEIRPSFASPPSMTTPSDQAGAGASNAAGLSSSAFQYQPSYPPTQPHRPRKLSQNSLDSTASVTLTEGEDRIHLTSAAAGFSHPQRVTDENAAEQGRRRLQRPQGHYGERGRTMGTLKTMGRNIRRASMRVVNLAGVTLEDRPMRLDDSPEDVRRNTPLPGQDEEMPELSRERLRGRTLGIFGLQSVLRRSMLSFLLWRWTEPIILLLIMFNAVVLTIQAHRSVFIVGREDGFFHTWEDYALFVLFIIFTLEAFARILVTGLLLDPTTRWTDYQLFFQKVKATPGKVHSRFGTVASTTTVNMIEAKLPSESGSTVTNAGTAGRTRSESHSHVYPPERSSSSWVGSKLGFERHPFQLAIEQQQNLSEQNLPYLRHSWNRIDFVAVTSFWIMFALCVTGAETSPTRHLYIFRALSVLRVARLLAVTTGTTTIMRSLKIAGPLLARVSVFVLFAMVLFSIVGVQSFKGSFRRNCLLVVPDDDPINLGQSCGGQIDPVSLNATGYYNLDGQIIFSPKGFICPLGQICQEQDANPHNDIQSFDNIVFGALQVLIIAGANQWSPTMYQMMDSDFYAASIFFIVCIIVVNFWLINLFVAVITNTFSSIRVETKKSAFGAGTSGPVIDEKAEEWTMMSRQRSGARSAIQEWYLRTQLGWVVLVFADLVVQGTRTATSSDGHLQFLDSFELVATIAFDIEMVWRVVGYLPNWRGFNERGLNWFDLFLAVTTSIIQIPPIHGWKYYPWLTAFQLARFYRVILAVPTMRPLLLRVFGNMNGLWNMTLFLMIVNLLGALIAVQLFRGDVKSDNHMNFAETYSAFLAMYQVFSSENWTDILYLTADSEAQYKQALIAVFFYVGWFFFANFILLQMFIAVINENFEVAEEQKRARQFDAYLRKAEPSSTQVDWLERWNPYRFVKAAPKSVAVESMPSGLVLPLKKAIVQEGRGRRQESQSSISQLPFGEKEKQKGVAGTLRRLFDLDNNDVPETVQLASLKAMRRESVAMQAQLEENAEHRLEYLDANVTDPTIDETHEAMSEDRAKKADFIEAHPTYDKTFWVLSNQTPFRRLCQKLVSPAGGERIFGIPPSPIGQPFFQFFVFLAVIGGIIVAAIATPAYRRQYYSDHGLQRYTWFDSADVAFACALILEFLVKIIADGFIFTPNAYLLSVWNVIDFLILIALLINMITTIVRAGGVSRATRSLKAFRALRLITFFPWMRDTFHSVLFAGAQSLIEAALLALLYMVPYAIWGLNIFSGLMFVCNDDSRAGKSDCVGEYISQPVEDVDIGFLAPRSWDRPSPSTTFSFDSFGSSLLILFEVVSFEGWIDVMGVAMDVVGKDIQPQLNNSQRNSLFFLIYDLLGAVIILTLFISIIIGNFSSRSGMALLTEDQKRWIDLQKLIKHFLFLVLTTIYAIDIAVRILGLGLRSFRANGWNLFDVLVVAGSFATTVPIVLGSTNFAVEQLQKLFLVCIAFKLVQKNSGLNQLFKTSVSSLPAILKLLLLWIVLFIFFAIVYVEVFGLTRWGGAETHTQNYRDFFNALIMLVFMSTGEGWNQYMHDFTISYPACTNSGEDDPDSDCGSTGWAYTLFIAWNLLSMYIFVNMFTGVVVENFSYVFQLNNSKGSINRHEMRAFKKVWAMFDVEGTGFLTSASIVPFLSKLSGIFEVRTYPIEYSVGKIMEHSQANMNEARTVYSAPVISNGQKTNNIDIRRLGDVISQIDQREVSRRRATYIRLYHEAKITAESGKGISFTNMLLLLAHYKIIDDNSALRLDEMLQRRVTTEYVEDLVNLDRVRSLLRMIACRRRYLALREEQAAALRAEQDIPAIIVEDTPTTPKNRSWDITSSGNRDSQGFSFEGDSPSPNPIRPIYSTERDNSPDRSPYHSQPSSPVSLPRRSAVSGDFSRYADPRRESKPLGDKSHQQVLSTLDSSVWGEMMHEAAEEE